MRSRYKIHDENGIFFVTSTIVNWIPVFVNEAYFSIMINTMKHYQDKNDLIIYAYVFMPNHFHMIISDDDISKIMQSGKNIPQEKLLRILRLTVTTLS
ncbi:MAG: transposase [Ignavibacteria bacterium]|nr:transposase [Ignavibacteria bacterium]